MGDKEAAIMTRRLAREEGFFLGYSGGSAMQGLLQLKDQLTPEDVVVVIFHDHGSRYVSKVFNDDWMRSNDFLDKKEISLRDVIRNKGLTPIRTIHPFMSLSATKDILKQHDYDQAPISDGSKVLGSITISTIESAIGTTGDHTIRVQDVMNPPFPELNEDISLKLASNLLKDSTGALMVKSSDGQLHIITTEDLSLV